MDTKTKTCSTSLNVAMATTVILGFTILGTPLLTCFVAAYILTIHKEISHTRYVEQGICMGAFFVLITSIVISLFIPGLISAGLGYGAAVAGRNYEKTKGKAAGILQWLRDQVELLWKAPKTGQECSRGSKEDRDEDAHCHEPDCPKD